MEAVFIHCARDEYFQHRGVYHDDVPTLIYISYVCRDWRRIALNYAELWAYHFVVSPRWTEELLSRSKNASLKIRLENFYLFWLWNVAEKVMDHIERIEDLSLDFSDEFPDWILPKLSSPAPRLRNLKISVNEGAELNWPTMLFNGDTPALRTLELKRCLVPWNSFKLDGLTSLILSRLSDEFQESVDDFLDLLGRMPGVACLLLCRALTGATEFLSSVAHCPPQRINLLRLSCLYISSPLSTIIAFLSSVTFPSETIVRLDIEPEVDRPSYPDGFALLSPLLTQRLHMKKRHRTPICLLVVEFLNSEALRLGVSERDHDLPPSIYSRNPYLRSVPLDFNVYFDGTNLRDRFLGDFVSSLPRANIRRMHVIRPAFSLTLWRTILGDLRGLSHIKLSRGGMPDLFEVGLSDAQAAGDGEPGRTVVAPALEELELHEMAFSERDDHGGSVITLRRLLDALSRRGHPAGRLKIARCRIGNCAMPDVDQLWGDIQAVD